MSDEKQQSDSLQPSWAAHELFALVLTLVPVTRNTQMSSQSLPAYVFNIASVPDNIAWPADP